MTDPTPGAIALEVLGTGSSGSGVGVYSLQQSSGTAAFGIEGVLDPNSPGEGSAAIYGNSFSTTAIGPGVLGQHYQTSGTAPGVLGQTYSNTSNSRGVEGQGGSCGSCIGVYGSVPGNGIAVRGETPAAVTNAWGVEGIGSSSGIGVYGHTPAASSTSYGVLGNSGSSAAEAAGVYGQITSGADYAAGVRGANSGANCCGFGVVGFSAGQGIGIGGYAPNGFGVFGWSPNNWAAWLDGAVTITKDLHVYGTLYKGGGAFRIDHPLDPAHSYLQHSFVESPDMKNIYDGNVTTNAKGFATVTLPAYFQDLNKDFRYQLTIVGTRGWRARVVKEIANNRFTIQTDLPRVKVSWQVTGIRHDAYANAHRIQVRVPKTGADAGKYAYPGLYGQPKSKSVTAIAGMPKTPPRLKEPALPKQR